MLRDQPCPCCVSLCQKTWIHWIPSCSAFCCASKRVIHHHAMGFHLRIGSIILGCAVACCTWWEGQRSRDGEGHFLQTLERADLGGALPECHLSLQEEHACRVAVQCLPCHQFHGQELLSHVQWEEGVALGAQSPPSQWACCQYQFVGATAVPTIFTGIHSDSWMHTNTAWRHERAWKHVPIRTQARTSKSGVHPRLACCCCASRCSQSSGSEASSHSPCHGTAEAYTATFARSISQSPAASPSQGKSSGEDRAASTSTQSSRRGGEGVAAQRRSRKAGRDYHPPATWPFGARGSNAFEALSRNPCQVRRSVACQVCLRRCCSCQAGASWSAAICFGRSECSHPRGSVPDCGGTCRWRGSRHGTDTSGDPDVWSPCSRDTFGAMADARFCERTQLGGSRGGWHERRRVHLVGPHLPVSPFSRSLVPNCEKTRPYSACRFSIALLLAAFAHPLCAYVSMRPCCLLSFVR